HLGVVDDRGVRGMRCGHTDGSRFDLGQPLLADEFDSGDTVGSGTVPDVLEARELWLVASNDDLAALVVRHIALPAEVVQQPDAAAAQPGLEASGFVI